MSAFSVMAKVVLKVCPLNKQHQHHLGVQILGVLCQTYGVRNSGVKTQKSVF